VEVRHVLRGATFLFIRKPTIKDVHVGSYTASNARRAPCLFTLIRFGCEMAGEIVHIVERQVNNDSPSSAGAAW
jgi:hypothetical protein